MGLFGTMTAGMRTPGSPYGRLFTTENGVITTINGRATNQGGGGGGGSGPQSAADMRRSRSNFEFLQAQEDKANALAGVEVEMAEQAMQDSKDASQKAAAVLGGSGNREVGGGAFSRLRGRSKGVSLGGLLTGGLASANREALGAAKRKAVNTGYKAKLESLQGGGRVNATLGVSNELAKLNKAPASAKV